MPVVGLGNRSSAQFEISVSRKNDRVSEYLSGESLQSSSCVWQIPGAIDVRSGTRVSVRGVIDHQLRDDAQTAAVRLGYEILEVLARAVLCVDIVIVGNVIAVILPGGRVDGSNQIVFTPRSWM